MSTKYNGAGLGDISVDNEVIKNIALKAAIEVGGVHEIGQGRISKIWAKLAKKSAARGVKLEFSDTSELRITLKLLVDYGTNIPHAAGAAQENVKKAVEHMTGLTISEVAVKIVGMERKREKEVWDENI